MTILLTILFVIGIALYNAYLILDNRTPDDDPKNAYYQKMWHIFGACIFCLLAFTFQYSQSILLNGHYVITSGWQVSAFVLSSFWLIFAGIVHFFALNKPIFYVGTTALTDRMIRSAAKFFKMEEEKMCAILKCSAFILSMIFAII